MKIESLKLVYFSPTGTTKKIIQAIAQGIDLSAVETVDVTKPEGRKQRLRTAEGELLIIGTPVYFGRVQADVLEWLLTIEAHNTPAVCIVVYGNREFDDALLELKDTAVKSGCRPIACAAFIGEHSFSNLETPIAAGRPDAEDLNRAESFGKKIKGKILSVPSVNHFTEITVSGNYPYIDMIDSKKRLASVDFIAVDNSCLQCGECAQHCPVRAIDSEDSASIDMNKCILCHACIKMCPANARKINNEMIRSIARGLSQACQDRKDPIFFL